MRKIFILLIVFLIFGFGVFTWQGIYLPRSELALLRGLPKSSTSVEEKLFSVEKGQNPFQIAENLEREGLIKNKIFFEIYIILRGKLKMLQAGDYFLSPSMNIPEIARKIISGEIVKIAVTIPEGFTLNQIQERLSPFPNVTKSFLVTLMVGRFKKEFQFLEDAPNNATLEGFLFPDTYQFSYGVGPEEIVKKMLDNFDKKLAPYRNEVSGTGLTLFDVITMASLIEKEVKTLEDKKLVSGILWKRLKVNMPLQVDATITYILRTKTTNPEGVASRPYGARVSIEETQIDSPYNTYKTKGLPLGPICNPGLESILAAIYPKSSEYWYYLSTPEGKTIFSRTLNEHNINKAKYLK